MKKLFLGIGIVLFLCSTFTFASCKQAGDKKTNYQITCSLSDDYILTGSEMVEFYNSTENAFRTLKFNLFANAFL